MQQDPLPHTLPHARTHIKITNDAPEQAQYLKYMYNHL